jgi:hypothetical protein
MRSIPGEFKGALININDHRLFISHCFVRALISISTSTSRLAKSEMLTSRSNMSRISIPHNAKRYSCCDCQLHVHFIVVGLITSFYSFPGHTSKAGVSPATAAKYLVSSAAVRVRNLEDIV